MMCYRGKTSLPFTSRSAWLQSQLECSDLRRVHSRLKQDTRPSKKLTNIKDVKRYLNLVSISRDGLLVVKRDEPFAVSRECIVIPRSVIDGFLAALHVKLDHPSGHQMKLVSQHYFFALDLDKTLDRCSQCCHLCSSLKKVPSSLVEQSTSDPPDGFGISFPADVIKRYRQLVIVVHETSTSFTAACLLDDECCASIRSSLLQLCLELHPLPGPPSIIMVDPAPGFASLSGDEILRQYGFAVEVGRVKNPNKNPVAEKCVAELGDELLRVCPEGTSISSLSLAVATANLNTHIHNRGLSAREMWLQCDQFTNTQFPFSDLQVVRQQHSLRVHNHPASERSKAPGCCPRPAMPVQVNDLVYITSDGSKTNACNQYLVVSVDGLWCNVHKFTGLQLRSTSYRDKLSECYRVPDLTETTSNLSRCYSSASHSEDIDEEPFTSGYVDKEPAPLPTPQSTPISAPTLVPSELATPHDPEPDIPPVPESSPPLGGNMTDGIDTPIPESASSSGPRRSSCSTCRLAYLKDYVTY